MNDLVELKMVGFDINLGMAWFRSCYVSIDRMTHVVKFQIPNEPSIEWISNSIMPKGRFISYHKVRMLVLKGYIYQLVRVNESIAEVTL